MYISHGGHYMFHLKRLIFCFALISCILYSDINLAKNTINIPILCYHNFNPTVPGSMNMTPDRFESQISWLKMNGFTIIPLKDAVEYLQGKRDSLPARPVVITADDGWQSVYTYMLPIVKKYNFPVTLFIYPQTISQGQHAMTWDELKELQKTGLFDIQGHTYWHPNFKREKRKLTPSSYQKFVKEQLVTSKNILDEKLGIKVTLLAWPFGIYDKYLEEQAAIAGYDMAFSIDDQAANRSYRPLAQPRFMIVAGLSMNTFKNILKMSYAAQHA